MVELFLLALRVELPTNTPVLLLRESSGQRTLPIFVGTPEATAIAYALQGINTPRPMTHDLIRDLLVVTEVDITSVVITDLRNGTYYSDIHLARDGASYTVSARPSDAIALAIRVGAPIFVEEDLIDSEGVYFAEEEISSDPEELVSQFRHFIDEVQPEDFLPGQ